MASFIFSSSGSEGRLKVPVIVAVRQAAISLFSTNGEYRERQQIGKGIRVVRRVRSSRGSPLPTLLPPWAPPTEAPTSAPDSEGTWAAEAPSLSNEAGPQGLLSASHDNQIVTHTKPHMAIPKGRQGRPLLESTEGGSSRQKEQPLSSLPHSPPGLLQPISPCRRGGRMCLA